MRKVPMCTISFDCFHLKWKLILCRSPVNQSGTNPHGVITSDSSAVCLCVGWCISARLCHVSCICPSRSCQVWLMAEYVCLPAGHSAQPGPRAEPIMATAWICNEDVENREKHPASGWGWQLPWQPRITQWEKGCRPFWVSESAVFDVGTLLCELTGLSR